MAKKAFFILLLLILGAGCASWEINGLSEKIENIAALKKTDRILILAPHPDDESIGCAGIIQEALKAGSEVKIAYLTNGDHNQAAFIVYEKRITIRQNEFIHMGEVRKKEAVAAMKSLGVPEKNLIFLGYPDFGTFAIFSRYWQSPKPYRSTLTRISSVPYKTNFSYGAAYNGENILMDIKRMLLDYRPTKIFVSHPADVNVDHKTFYLFLEVALADLRGQIPKPKVYPYLIHCVGWPLPRHYHPQLALEPPKKFLNSSVDWQKFDLSEGQLNKKHGAILCYRSQTASSAFYLLSFARRNELFGGYPDINLDDDEEISYIHALHRFLNIDGPNNFAISREGKPKVTYELSKGNLLIRIEDKNRGLNRRLSLRCYLFGYSYKTPFSAMPKIWIVVMNKKFRAFDKKKTINPPGLGLDFGREETILKVPLEVLGEPDFILASVKGYANILPSDAASFRKINIR